ncbi:SKP1-like protein 1A, partial [Tanacetum coccineum]
CQLSQNQALGGSDPAVVADMIRSKTPEELRKLCNIVNDFTPAAATTALHELKK